MNDEPYHRLREFLDRCLVRAVSIQAWTNREEPFRSVIDPGMAIIQAKGRGT